jgi:hypothetical protein
MANSVSTITWSLRMPAGSVQNWTFVLTTTAPGGVTPWPITGATWEYVARTAATDLTIPPLIELTTTAGSQGVLTVTNTSATSSVAMDMYPAATATVTPGTYYHALWMNPSTAEAFCWFTGNLLIEGNPQP